MEQFRSARRIMEEFKIGRHIEDEWVINYNQLQPVPYPLKSGFRQIPITDTIQVIIHNIRECLRMRSIHALYDNESAVARCKNDSFVIFEVRLFLGNKYDELRDENDSIILHLHRIKGCGFSFRDECMAILNAAENKAIPLVLYSPPTTVPEESSEFTNKDIALLEQVLSNTETDLRSHHRETQIHALQNLAFMTNPTKSLRRISFMTSKRIMESDIRKSIISFLVLGRFNSTEKTAATYTFMPRTSNAAKGHDREVLEVMRNLCLTVLSNTMSELTTTNTPNVQRKYTPELNLHLHNNQTEEWFTNDRVLPSLINTLIADIQQFKIYPHLAVLAARCLFLLFQHHLGARDMVNQSGILSILDQARCFAKASHFGLEEALYSFYASDHSLIIHGE